MGKPLISTQRNNIMTSKYYLVKLSIKCILNINKYILSNFLKVTIIKNIKRNL